MYIYIYVYEYVYIYTTCKYIHGGVYLVSLDYTYTSCDMYICIERESVRKSESRVEHAVTPDAQSTMAFTCI